MGVAAGLVLAGDVAVEARPRLSDLRIAIAARSVECEAPSHWPGSDA